MLPVVLLVDDDRALLAALGRTFRHEPFRLVGASDTATARGVLGREIVDVLVCDHMMPGARGTDFLAEVRLMYPEVIPIMLTGATDLRVAVDAVALADVFRFFTKPCDARELGHAIRLALGQRDAIRAARRLMRHAVPDPAPSHGARPASGAARAPLPGRALPERPAPPRRGDGRARSSDAKDPTPPYGTPSTPAPD